MKSNFTSIMLSGAAVAAMLLLAGCAKEDGLNPVDKSCAELELTDVNSGEMLSKAAIDGTGFPRDGRIGLFFFKDEAGAELYGDGACSNVEYSYNQDKSKWTASPAIRVGSTPGYLYGYYPYNGADKDVKSIAVESSLDGDDAMYVAKQGPVTDQTAGNTSITMRHALARVSITVKNKGYSGAAKLSRIEFVGAKTAQKGTLNALDGSISATKSNVTLEVPETNQQITEAGTRYECLLVPSEVDAKAQNVTLRLTIDGQQKTVSLTGENAMKIVSGVKARLEIDLSDSGLSVVGGIYIDEWQTVVVGGHTVTVKLSDDVTPHDILTDIYVDGDNVIIRASSFQGHGLVCNVGDNAKCERLFTNDKFTFIISEICSNIEAVLGYAPLVTLNVQSDSNGKAWIGDDDSKTSGQFEIGQQVVIHALPNDNFRLFRWNDNNRETSRTITLGEADVTYSASFILSDLIPGLFTVNSDGKQVFFSKGNLFWNGEEFDFEDNQYTVHTESSDEPEHHIAHFYWSKSSDVARSLSNYSDAGTPSDIFFANNPGSFKVNGHTGWSVLTGNNDGEWKYLIERKDSEGNALYNLGVKVCGSANCLILLPDDWKWEENGVGTVWQNEYSESTTVKWSTMEAAGAVCLPAAGYRNGGPGFSYPAYVNRVGINGYYWSASPSLGNNAYDLDFDSGNVLPSSSGNRYQAYSVRLVTESK